MSTRRGWIKRLRLGLAFLSMPVVLWIWLTISLDLIAWHHATDHDGIDVATLMLDLSLLPPVSLILLSALVLGCPYILFMFATDQLDFRTVMLPTTLVALASGLVICASVCLWGHPSFAPMFGTLSALGGIVCSLCFYLVAVWRMIPEK